VHDLSFGFSPCPNDTFAFHAVVHDLIGSDVRVRPELRDIEDLNRAARTSELELSKLSVGALANLGDRYVPLRAGAALGHGVGPLVVAREPATLAAAAAGTIAVPGLDTTAFLLLRLAAPELGEVVELRYDRILDAVAEGEVDAGLIIHESRFTYQDHGLVKVADLGEWWEADTGLPVPLAVIGARRDLDPELVGAAESALRRSVEHAFAHPEASRAYVRAHSQELSDEVCDRHIALYVNEFSIDLGDDGLRAVQALMSRTDP
jgi:1,4-dihydroxy-6-naphthoate synthase